ncbi:DnaJ-domain-containing protein [Decorospora gaudefroyi]|uniref:DnaJ-domain-containing protein n=1 Tax=Decorospora gaudefroyi TaxID=184978 RepID=A0A6A5KWG4_9PLEO|nr:DnaJ-domain-containing protein [Decorospora gaudefroyi]
MAPPAPTHDYYVTLEVLPSALHDEVKASYRRLARLHHPDKNHGCKIATAKTQRINVAWEVLGDAVKRSDYDRTRPQSSASTSTTPQTNWQAPPRPDTSAQDQKRREWLNFEKYQEQQIRQCQNAVKPLEAEVAALHAKIDRMRGTCSRLSDEEKSEIRLQSIHAENAIRIKQIPLGKEKARLQRLTHELARRRDQEDVRLAAEQAEKARKERLARQKAEQARQQEWARQRAAQEAQEKAARAAAEKLRREQWAAQEARNKVAREAAERERAEVLKKRQEEMRNREASFQKWREAQAKKQRATPNAEQAQKGKTRKTTTAQTKSSSSSSSSCTHKGWWADVQGRHVCAHCTRPLHKFAYQCPGCSTLACVSCRNQLKAGLTPSIDTTHPYGKNTPTATRTARPTARDNYRPSYHTKSRASPEYDYDYYDWD